MGYHSCDYVIIYITLMGSSGGLDKVSSHIAEAPWQGTKNNL